MLGRHHHLALHQPAGGVFVVLQRLLDRGAVDVVERAQDPLLLRRLHVLGEIDDVVGLELLHRRARGCRRAARRGSRRAPPPRARRAPSRRARTPQSAISALRSGRLSCSRRSATSASCSGSSSATSASWSPASTAASTASMVCRISASGAGAASRPSSPVSLMRASSVPDRRRRPYTLPPAGKAPAGTPLDRRPRMRPADRRRRQGATPSPVPASTIDLDAVAANWRALDALSAPTVETAAVVKADAYGLGAAMVAPALAAAGARTFFVALAEEGAALREALGPGPAIHVFAGLMPRRGRDLPRLRPRPLPEQPRPDARGFARELAGHPFALQLNSGMNRLGLDAADLDAAADLLPASRRCSTLSHLACADDARPPDEPPPGRSLRRARRPPARRPPQPRRDRRHPARRRPSTTA